MAKLANVIEKHMPKRVREKLQLLIAAALGLFLGLRYNDYVRSVVSVIIPETDSLLYEGLILMGLTIGIVYLSIFIQSALDGK